jgi:anion-transporting  ArsA/GET3 family ATPase
MTLLAIHPMLLLVSTLIATGCSLILTLQLRRMKKRLFQCRTELTHMTSDADSTDGRAETTEPQEKPQTADFMDSLLQATLKQRLQKGPEWRQPPEKYRYAAALADQGMDAKGIAAVLQFPIEAAQQLIALKRAAQTDPATVRPDK